MMEKIILFNPWSANYGYRIPNSVLQVAASIEGLHDYVIIDGNREADPWIKIETYLKKSTVKYFGCTVMPGPQLKQAIPFTKKIKKNFPHIITIWGGYFASNQHKVSIESGYVDYIIDGPGDNAFPHLIAQLENNGALELVPNLIYRRNNEVRKNHKDPLPDLDALSPLPYEKLNNWYPLTGYLKKTFLGNRTAAYHSSFGCPFTCSFCAVVPIYNARWRGKSAAGIYKDVLNLINTYGADAVEFHDNNFFVSEKRTVEFASLLIPNHKISWWGEGRIDTLNKYSDESLKLIREAGCKMIFFGAETGNDGLLQKMDKGGTQTAEQIINFAARLKKFDIIPEYSFVLGFPAATEEEVNFQIQNDINFIMKIKEVNPSAEIIIYIYSPVPVEGSELYETVKKSGFSFPQKLEDWLTPAWENFDLRRNPLTPWLKPYMIDKIRGFETVLNAYYPTFSDFKLSTFQRTTIRKFAALRYKFKIYRYPYELKALQKFWLRYRQPETEGFSMEEQK